MSSPKQRRKARRKAEKLMDQAWEAVLHDNLLLAAKESRRAVDAGPINPRLWLDYGRILAQCGDDDEADMALRQAIALAPGFAEAFAELAQLQARKGKTVQAVRLQQRAVELAPSDATAREHLASYTALRPAEEGPHAVAAAPGIEFTERTARYDWDEVAAALRRHGAMRLPGLLSLAECQALIACWDEPGRFEYDVRLDSDTTGRVVYRFFTRPLPPLVAAVRSEVYGRVALICNGWQELLGRADRYPVALTDFLARCRDAGQHRTTPILLRYPENGFNAPHRDIAGKVVFPVQLAVTLGPGCDSDGGDLLLTDQRPGKRIRQRAVTTQVGDGVLFCTRERLVEIAGTVGLQPVQHGVSSTRRERFALGIPFHEHG